MRDIQRRNEQELELGLVGSGSWHEQYKDSAYIYVGGLPFDLTEGDVITIFSQFGEVMNIHLPKPREEAKEERGRDGRPQKQPRHRGFGFLMYEDQRSTILAVDNLNGAQVLGRTLRVDHVANFKHERVPDADGNLVEPDEQAFNCAPPETVVDEEPEDDIDLSDPMAAYIADEKKKRRPSETDEERRRRKERRREKERGERGDERRRSHRHDSERHRSHRHHHDNERGDSERRRSHRHRHDSEQGDSERRRSHRHDRSAPPDSPDREKERRPDRSASPHRRTPAARDTPRDATPPGDVTPPYPAGDATPPYPRGLRAATP